MAGLAIYHTGDYWNLLPITVTPLSPSTPWPVNAHAHGPRLLVPTYNWSMTTSQPHNVTLVEMTP